MLNLDNAAEVYVKNNGEPLVFARLMDGKLIIVREYGTEKEAVAAVAMMADEMGLGRKEVVCVPTPEEVRASIASAGMAKPHHISGKKTKGHGGS